MEGPLVVFFCCYVVDLSFLLWLMVVVVLMTFVFWVSMDSLFLLHWSLVLLLLLLLLLLFCHSSFVHAMVDGCCCLYILWLFLVSLWLFFVYGCLLLFFPCFLCFNVILFLLSLMVVVVHMALGIFYFVG